MAIVSAFPFYVIWKFQVVYTRLPALISSILNNMDAVRTVKVCIFNPSFSFIRCVYPNIDGLLAVYTVSEVDLN
jgi:hypothetical protein